MSAEETRAEDPHPTAAERRERLLSRQKSRRDREPDKGRRQSMEGLRLGALLRQLEALQAVQGLQELKPSPGKTERRLKISDDPSERARQRQWLRFKADWLEALLESTLEELDEMDAYEASKGAGESTPAPPPS